MGIDCTQPLSNSTEANGSQPETNVSHHEGDCKTRVSSRDTNLSLSSHYPVSQSSSLWGDKQENETFFVCYFSHLYLKKTSMNPDMNCCTFVFLFLDFVCCCFSEGVGGYFQTLIMGGLPLLKIQPCDASIHLLLIQCPVNLILLFKNTACSFVKSSAEARMRRTGVA